MHNGWRKGIEQFRNRFFAQVYSDVSCDAEEEKSNAILIAAAPDLLDELRKALDSLEYVERIFPGMAGCGVRQERISSARSVIEKATGEQA